MPASQSHSLQQTDCRLTANAVVLAARGDGCVDLEFEPAPACQGCAGTCLWRRLQATRIDRIPVRKALAPGARVQVSLTERRVFLASVLLYGLPLVAIVLGAVTGAAITQSDIGTLVGALFGVGLVIAMFRRFSQRIERATLGQLVVSADP